MKLPLLLTVCFLSMLLVGCPAPGMTIKVVDSSAKHLSLEMSDDNMFGTAIDKQISSISFQKRVKQTGEVNEVWSVESQKREGSTLTKIIYGKVPTGFSATTPQPLLPGDTIYIVISSTKSGSPASLRTVEVTVSE